MDKEYFYNYLKNYILENGERIVGLDNAVLKNTGDLEEFLEMRAQSAFAEFNLHKDSNLPAGGAFELAMEVLLSGLKELEPTEEEKTAEEQYRKECEEEERMMRDSDYYN